MVPGQVLLESYLSVCVELDAGMENDFKIRKTVARKNIVTKGNWIIQRLSWIVTPNP